MQEPSLPMRECGLKLTIEEFRYSEYVTPHAGVWIETVRLVYIAHLCIVTPHAGVWIETFLACLQSSF